MSTFSDKIRNNCVPDPQEWSAHLIEAHAQNPSLTPKAFSAYRTDGGLNSYEILSDVLLRRTAGPLSVIDLGCGDGHLVPYLLRHLDPQSKVIGLDFSLAAIDLARVQVKDPRVCFLVADAHSLPLPDGIVDHVFCHMAIMLMSPLDVVVSEIKRVLKPDGTFSAVVAAGRAVGLFKEIQRLAGLFVQAHIPRFIEARSESWRTGSGESIGALFGDAFNRDTETYEFHLNYHVGLEGIWDYMKSMYFFSILPESARHELKGDLMAAARDFMGSDGKVLFHVPMKLVSLKRS